MQVPSNIDDRPQFGQHRSDLLGKFPVLGGKDGWLLRERFAQLENPIYQRITMVKASGGTLQQFQLDILTK